MRRTVSIATIFVFFSRMKPVDKESCRPVSTKREREKEREKEKFTRGWKASFLVERRKAEKRLWFEFSSLFFTSLSLARSSTLSQGEIG